MEAIISVQLQDCPSSIEAQHQRQAEARFERELRRSFPNDEALKRAFKLFSDASEGGTISKAEEKVAATWKTAYDKARQAGFRDIAVEEAYFDVKVG